MLHQLHEWVSGLLRDYIIRFPVEGRVSPMFKPTKLKTFVLPFHFFSSAFGAADLSTIVTFKCS